MFHWSANQGGPCHERVPRPAYKSRSRAGRMSLHALHSHPSLSTLPSPKHQPVLSAAVYLEMASEGSCLVEAMTCARDEGRLTAGVYECAKIMNDDPDSVAFCVLAMDEEFECDIALQIHFTLIQAFCFDNDISIVRVSDAQRLAELLGDAAAQLEDAHCVLITVRRACSLAGGRAEAALLTEQPELQTESSSFSLSSFAHVCVCSPPTEPRRGLVGRPRSGKAARVLRREPQLPRVGSGSESARALSRPAPRCCCRFEGNALLILRIEEDSDEAPVEAHECANARVDRPGRRS
ncbi:hypothetical protein AOLI_G00208540 [Acnodon oligacanthus]